MEIFYSLDEAAKEIRNNKFYTEEDAVRRAMLAARTFALPIKIFLWRESKKIEYAVVMPNEEVQYKVNDLVQAMYGMESRGLEKEAAELKAVLADSTVYRTGGWTKVDIAPGTGKLVPAKYDIELKVEKDGKVAVSSFRINDVEDKKAGTDLIHNEFVQSGKDVAAEVERVMGHIKQGLEKYPLGYEEKELETYRLLK